jgi:hypothetical protein
VVVDVLVVVVVVVVGVVVVVVVVAHKPHNKGQKNFTALFEH